MWTHVLAAFLGFYLIITGIFVLVREDLVISSMKEVMKQKTLMLFSGLSTIMFGLVLVLSHTLYEDCLQLAISILGWLALFSGVMRLFCPERVFNMWRVMLKHTGVLKFSGVISVILGLLLVAMA